MDFSQGLSDAWASVAEFVPRALLFVVILGVGYLIAKAVSTVLDKALQRVGFDRAVERGGIRRMLQKSQYDASDVLSKLAFYAIMLLVLKLAFNAFGPDNAVSTVLDSVISYLPKVFAAALIIVVASAIGAAVREIVDVAASSRPYGKTLASVCGGVFVAIGIFAALDQLQIAQTITNAVFYAILAALVGVTVVAVGGAGIRPMQKYWENGLNTVATESKELRENSGDTRARLADRARQRQHQAANSMQGEQRPSSSPRSAAPRQDRPETVDVREAMSNAGRADSWTVPEEDIWDECDGSQGSSNHPRRPQGF